jgi:hypothetical protein
MNTGGVAGCSRFFQLPLFKRNIGLYRKSCYKLLQSKIPSQLCKSKRPMLGIDRQKLPKPRPLVQGEGRNKERALPMKHCGQTCRPP